MASPQFEVVRHLKDESPLGLAMNRAADGGLIGGNAVTHLPDSPGALDAMLAAIRGATRQVHLENYIIRADRTGQRFAEALAERAAAGIPTRVLYDSLGSIGTRPRYWRALRKAGVDVRPFHPLLATRPIDLLSRDHRKLLVVDGTTAILGGVCLGDEWAGDSSCNQKPWRDTCVQVEGPAAVAIDRTFARVWAIAGDPLPAAEMEIESPDRGDVQVRIVDGVPGRSRIFRVAQLAYDTAVNRIWIWDAYLVPPPSLLTALLDAARSGVDVRVMVPSTSDIRLVRDLTRFGYRDFLRAGVRVFEWRGPMLHAKAMLTDKQWVRIGSSNLNVSSLYANHELDVLVESTGFNEELADQYRRDMTHSYEIVLQPGRYLRRGRLVDTEAVPEEQVRPQGQHHRTRFERGLATVVTLRRIAGGMRTRFTATIASVFAVLGLLLVLFPRPTSLVLASVMFTASGMIAFEAFRTTPVDERRRRPRAGPQGLAAAPPEQLRSELPGKNG